MTEDDAGRRDEMRRAYLREYKRKQRLHAKASGICIVCVKEPVFGRTTCLQCSEKSVSWQRAHSWKKSITDEM